MQKNSIPLHNNKVKKRILLMSEDIKEQVITEIKDKFLFNQFSIQLNESVCVCPQSHN